MVFSVARQPPPGTFIYVVWLVFRKKHGAAFVRSLAAIRDPHPVETQVAKQQPHAYEYMLHRRRTRGAPAVAGARTFFHRACIYP